MLTHKLKSQLDLISEINDHAENGKNYYGYQGGSEFQLNDSIG